MKETSDLAVRNGPELQINKAWSSCSEEKLKRRRDLKRSRLNLGR